MENSRRCEICNVTVHRASMQKHLGIKKHLETEKQNEMIIREGLFKKSKHLLKIKLKKHTTKNP